MNLILPKHEDLERVGQKVAFEIFMEGMKKCNKCGEVKNLGEFNKDKNKKDGLKSQCKACQKAYYEDNKEKINKRMKAYREDNKEKNKARYEDNKEKYAEKKKAYYETNKDKYNERSKAYHESKRNEHIQQLKQIMEPNTDGKWIYIMQCGIYNKIGISKNPLRRVEEIENMTQAPTELVYLAKANYGRTIDTEQIIHHELSSLNLPMPYANGRHENHVSKEWFFGSLDKMVEIVSQYATISKID
jgi:hypothetical protein